MEDIYRLCVTGTSSLDRHGEMSKVARFLCQDITIKARRVVHAPSVFPNSQSFLFPFSRQRKLHLEEYFLRSEQGRIHGLVREWLKHVQRKECLTSWRKWGSQPEEAKLKRGCVIEAPSVQTKGRTQGGSKLSGREAGLRCGKHSLLVCPRCFSNIRACFRWPW